MSSRPESNSRSSHPKMVDHNDVASFKASFGISTKDFVVLSLGRVAKEKSIDVCLRGYADFLKSDPKVPTKMLIVGGGPALDDLKALAASLGSRGPRCLLGGGQARSDSALLRLRGLLRFGFDHRNSRSYLHGGDGGRARRFGPL
jgi:glycosyltransferase involved in cell wall biosynthesis